MSADLKGLTNNSEVKKVILMAKAIITINTNQESLWSSRISVHMQNWREMESCHTNCISKFYV